MLNGRVEGVGDVGGKHSQEASNRFDLPAQVSYIVHSPRRRPINLHPSCIAFCKVPLPSNLKCAYLQRLRYRVLRTWPDEVVNADLPWL